MGRAVSRCRWTVNPPHVSTGSDAVDARICSDATGEGLGVARQLAECRKLAETKGWTVREEYVDNDVSAYKVKVRPEYERMLRDLEDGARDAVVVHNLDRLTRQPIQLERFTALCERAGVRHVAIATADFDLGNDAGLFLARIFAAFAAKESGRKSARLKSKARELAEHGLPDGGHHRPFGYEADRRTMRPVEAELIRQLAARAIEGGSLRSLALWLRDTGVPSVLGAEWRTPTMQQILTSPRIAGFAHRWDIVCDAVWEPIITRDRREQLLQGFAAKRLANRRAPQFYLLSGMLRCGNKLFSSRRQDTCRYVCLSGPDHGGCGRLTIVGPSLEEWIAEAVLYRLDSRELADALSGRRTTDTRAQALATEIDSDVELLAEFARMAGARELTVPEWRAAREPVEARIQSGRRQLVHLSSTHALDAHIGQGDGLRARWDAMVLDQRITVVRAVLDFATIQPDTPGARVPDLKRVEPSWRCSSTRPEQHRHAPPPCRRRPSLQPLSATCRLDPSEQRCPIHGHRQRQQ